MLGLGMEGQRGALGVRWWLVGQHKAVAMYSTLLVALMTAEEVEGETYITPGAAAPCPSLASPSANMQYLTQRIDSCCTT